jgi:hypothetical protein
VSFDPEALRRLAVRTQAQAKLAVAGGIGAGLVTGSLFGYAAMLIFQARTNLVWPGLAAGAVLGAVAGWRKAVALRFQAQMAFCQLQIEENTRKPKVD